jgi:hypothetical protein
MADPIDLPIRYFQIVDPATSRVTFAASNIETPPAEWTEINESTYVDYMSRPEELPYLYWRNGEVVYEPPPPDESVVSEISRRQFYQGMAVQGEITEQEALDAVAVGEIPATMQTMVDGLPADQQFPAVMLLTGAALFQIDHPLTQQMAVAYGWTPVQLQDFWNFAATL